MDYQEAIEHAREVAKRKRAEATYNFPTLVEYYNECKKCADEHEQLAEWLEELKQYEQLGTLEEVREAVEKQAAISREIIEGKYFCPKCHNLMPYPGYCGCGQKLY